MEMQGACEIVVRENEGILACALVDLETSLVLAHASRDQVAPSVVDQAARTASRIFRGRFLAQFVQALSPAQSVDNYLREAQVTTGNNRLFLAVIPGWPNALIALVAEKGISIGLGWMALHHSLDQFGRAEPATDAPEPEAQPEAAATELPASEAVTESPATEAPTEAPAEVPPARPIAAEPTVRPAVTELADAPKEPAKRPGPRRVPDRVGARGAFFTRRGR